METSLRYSKSLKIHAKEKLPFNSKTHLQLHGELDTGTGSPSYFCAMIRHLFPEASTGLGVGFHYEKRHKLRCHVRGKKEFPLITNNNLVTFNIKGRCDFDQNFNQKNPIGAAEFAWNIMNFKEDQDVRFKVGYEMFDKVPYMQIRENNWTLNANMKGKWNLRVPRFAGHSLGPVRQWSTSPGRAINMDRSPVPLLVTWKRQFDSSWRRTQKHDN